MDTEKSILKEVAQALYNDDFNAFKQTVLRLLNFDEADEKHAPTSANPDLNILLKNFCAIKAGYVDNLLALMKEVDPYSLCEWVDETQDPSPCPNYDEWKWESNGAWEYAQTLAFDDPMYDEREAFIETLYDKYGDSCVKALREEWVKRAFDEIQHSLNRKNVLFRTRSDLSLRNFLHFLPRAKEGKINTFSGMLSRSEYKFLLQIKVYYERALYHFKQSDLYRNAVMLGLGDRALTAFDDTFNAQYNPHSSNTINIASENNVIEKLTLALKSFDDVTTTAITKRDLRYPCCDITYPSLDVIAQAAYEPHTIAEILPNGERKLFNTYRISGTPMEYMCLEELLSHLPYEPEQIIDGIKLCCDSTKCNTVDKILSQLACNLSDYVPYDEKPCDKDGVYEDIAHHFIEGTDLEKALNQFHAAAMFDYSSFGRQLAWNGCYCLGDYGYITHLVRVAEACSFQECQFNKSDVCTLGLYAAGLLGKYSSLVSSDDKLSPIPTPALASSLLLRLESCGIVLEDLTDYEQTITTKHEEKRPFDASIFDRIVCAYKPPEERKKSTLSEDLQAAQAAANRQTQQTTSRQQSHNQTL